MLIKSTRYAYFIVYQWISIFDIEDADDFDITIKSKVWFMK